jgi:hypothetical protein
MWWMMLDKWWCDMIWLDVDVDILHITRIGLNDH